MCSTQRGRFTRCLARSTISCLRAKAIAHGACVDSVREPDLITANPDCGPERCKVMPDSLNQFRGNCLRLSDLSRFLFRKEVEHAPLRNAVLMPRGETHTALRRWTSFTCTAELLAATRCSTFEGMDRCHFGFAAEYAHFTRKSVFEVKSSRTAIRALRRRQSATQSRHEGFR